MNYNRCIIGGHLTRDCEMRYTPTGKAVTQFGVAINHNYTTESGEKKQTVTFLNVTAWGRTAETICQYFKKGDPILFEGRLTQDSWIDTQTQEKKTAIKIVLESFSFVKSKGKDDAPLERTERPGAGQPAGKPPAEAPPDDDDENQVPF